MDKSLAGRSYVCGFLFQTIEEDEISDPILEYVGVKDKQKTKRQYVALIRKSKPEFQKGRLNGIGGAVEPKDGPAQTQEDLDTKEWESPEAAMSREFEEETGVLIPESEWVRFCVFRDIKGYTVYFLKSFTEKDIKLRSITEEVVSWYPLDTLIASGSFKVMDNLKWLIPLALDKFQPMAEVEETFNATGQDSGSN